MKIITKYINNITSLNKNNYFETRKFYIFKKLEQVHAKKKYSDTFNNLIPSLYIILSNYSINYFKNNFKLKIK